jgi:zinc protease
MVLRPRAGTPRSAAVSQLDPLFRQKYEAMRNRTLVLLGLLAAILALPSTAMTSSQPIPRLSSAAEPAAGVDAVAMAGPKTDTQAGVKVGRKAAPKAGTAPRSAAGAKQTVFPYEVQRAALDNGLRVLMIPMPSEGLVAYWSVVRTGSRDEVEPGVTGFAHFFEHMMFRGSEKIPADVYDSIVSGMGANANAFTSDDLTAYHLSISREDLPKVIEIEADRFQHLSYTEDAFRTEAGAVYGEYRKNRTAPSELLAEALQNAAFDKHTYKHTTIGFEADIKRMPEQYAYSKSFFARFYRPENVVIMVIGDFDPASTLASIRAQYGSWPKGYQAPNIPVEPEQKAPRRITVPFDGQTLPMLTVQFKGDALRAGDRTMLAATLVAELAFGETSALYKKLVLDEQRVESLFPDFGFNRDPGLWGVYAVVKQPADIAAVEREIWSTIDGLRKDLVDPQRLAAARSHVKYAFLTRLTTPSSVAGSLSRFVALTGDMTVLEQMYSTLEQVTPEDLRHAADRYLRLNRSIVAILHSADQPLPAEAASGVAGVTGAAGVMGEAGAAGTATAQGRVSQPPVLLPVAQDPNVAFNVWVKVGTQDDPPGKEGLAALTAAMISDGGTQRLSYEKVLERLFPLAGSYNVSVDKEMTVVSGQVHRDNVAPFTELLVDAIVRPGFRQEDFERLRDRAVSFIENELRYSSDEELGKSTLYGELFRATPYAHIDEGTVEALQSITLDDVKTFHQRYFTRDNLVIGLGGAYAPDLPDKLSRELGALTPGTPPLAPAPRPERITGRHVTVVQKKGPSTAISFGIPIDLRRGSREFYALSIANSWLGEHRNSTSHLFQVIREARGMNYGDYSYIEAFPSAGQRMTPPTGVGRRQQLFEVWIRPVPRAQALFALRAGLHEVDQLVQNGLTQEQFEATRRFLRKYVLHFAETTAARLGYAVDDRYYGVDGHLALFRKMMDQITLADVNAAIRKYMQTDNLWIALVSDDAEGLKQAIAADTPSPIAYPQGVTKPASLLEEDKQIERYPLRVPAGNITVVPVDEMFQGGVGKAPAKASK